MKKIILFGLVAVLASCVAPDAKKMQKMMEDNPEILFGTIKKHPAKFLEVVNKAAHEAQKNAGKNAKAEEEKARAEEYKNPKKPEIQEWRAIAGKKDAPVTIVEYSDFQCPYCQRGANNVKTVLKNYGDKVRFVFKHLPLDFHPAAMPAAKIFEAINMQSADKAYKWHDVVFENQAELKSSDNGVAWMLKEAGKVGADVAKVKKAMDSEDVLKRVEADMVEAKKYGFRGTPGYLINGISLKGAYPPEDFAKIIDTHLKK